MYFRFVCCVVSVGYKLVVNRVLSRICCRRDRVGILAIAKLVVYSCACRTACVYKRLIFAVVRQARFCRGCRYKRICTGNGNIQFLRFVVDKIIVVVIADNFVVNIVSYGIDFRRNCRRPLAVVELVPYCTASCFACNQQRLHLARVVQIGVGGKFAERRICLCHDNRYACFGNVAVVVIPKYLVVHSVLACVCRRGYVGRPGTVRAEFVLHRAAVGYTCRDKFLRATCVDKVCNCRRHVGKSCV